MRRNSSRSSSSGRRGSVIQRRSENVRFDEFGFAVAKKKDRKLHCRCHDYSYPQLSSVRVKELCELLSYWNGASFICKSQMERFIRMGIPPSLRGRVWKCLLAVDHLRETSNFNYQKCLSEVRGPLVDLGVSEYGILSAIATLSDTQNSLNLNHLQPNCPEPRYSADDITLFRQIALDLQRSFPTHRSLMGDSPEAIEGQAKLFRVLIACARYNPQVGYTQGMSYIAAVLLMQMGEEEAFWALTALLDKPKYLAELFDLNLTKVQDQVKAFDQFLKHRKPRFSQHMESVGVLSVHFVTPWFLTLFTSLPCWDSVLAVWDRIILHGLSAVFGTALTIIELLEPRLMDLNDDGAVLPLLLRVPVQVAHYMVLVPALWNTEVQDWELKCMVGLVLDETRQGPTADDCLKRTSAEPSVEENIPSEADRMTEKDSTGAKSVLTKVLGLARQYLLDPVGRPRVQAVSQTQVGPKPNSPTPRRVFSHRTSASITQSQIRLRRRSQQRGRANPPLVPATASDANAAAVTAADSTSRAKIDRSQSTFRSSCIGPIGKVARHRSLVQPIRVKSLCSQRNAKKPVTQYSPTSSVLPPSLRLSVQSSCLPSSHPSGSFDSSSRDQEKQQDSPRTALIRELSSRHQSSVPFRNLRESKLI
ncbi:TBC1 domain family member 10A [Thalassophryne amazonica]|uniref:TBC1 domain family member 10A n=1 Tax=Thalassophryne amazonica TaxID=390379 RepID=UPI001470E460|nr:TBC1 domain family member 10A [Thalassophryne amazonica]